MDIANPIKHTIVLKKLNALSKALQGVIDNIYDACEAISENCYDYELDCKMAQLLDRAEEATRFYHDHINPNSVTA